jgi:hypothetical protein
MHPSLISKFALRQNAIDVSEARPSACRHVGLDCKTCVNGCAQKVASLCGLLSNEQQKSVFVKLYPDVVCHQNFPRFQKAYARQLESSERETVYELDCAVA